MSAPIDIRGLRLDSGKSQAARAEEIGVTRRVLGGAEHGRMPKSREDALKIAAFYGYKVTELWPLPEVEAA